MYPGLGAAAGGARARCSTRSPRRRRVRRQLHRPDDGPRVARARRRACAVRRLLPRRRPIPRWWSACTRAARVCGWQVESAEEARAAEAAGLRRRDRQGVGVGRAQARSRARRCCRCSTAVLDAVAVPVIAAGGIATARGVAAALAAGADGGRASARASSRPRSPTRTRSGSQAVLDAARRRTPWSAPRSTSACRSPGRTACCGSSIEAAEALADDEAGVAAHGGRRDPGRPLRRPAADAASRPARSRRCRSTPASRRAR